MSLHLAPHPTPQTNPTVYRVRARGPQLRRLPAARAVLPQRHRRRQGRALSARKLDAVRAKRPSTNARPPAPHVSSSHPTIGPARLRNLPRITSPTHVVPFLPRRSMLSAPTPFSFGASPLKFRL
eukprot:6179126-Pleurochrysis_carterae.AAC.1